MLKTAHTPSANPAPIMSTLRTTRSFDGMDAFGILAQYNLEKFSGANVTNARPRSIIRIIFAARLRRQQSGNSQ